MTDPAVPLPSAGPRDAAERPDPDAGGVDPTVWCRLARALPLPTAFFRLADQRCEFANPAYAALFGRAAGDLRGLTIEEVIGREAAREMQPAIERLLRGSEPVVQQRRLRSVDGTPRWIEVHLRSDRDPAAEGGVSPAGLCVTIRDVTEARAADEAARARIEHLAHHDPLTGLPNRAAFALALEAAIQGARSAGLLVALLFIDLDHFKRVNDSLGHPAGDQLLCTVGARITAALRATDLVARFGGDEFMVLLSGPPTGRSQEADVREVAQALLAAIGAPLEAGGRTISVTSSIGIALFPRDGATPAELVKNADSAMYGAKARGRAGVQVFDVRTSSAALAALVLESELARATLHNEFELHFQPQIGARDGRVRGAEALIRWRHPERGLLRPDAFIALAEERQLIIPIGQWVLREAARCAMRWRSLGWQIGPVAVNLSTIQLQSIGFLEAVAEVLPAAGITPAAGDGLIELELTERMLMDDLAQVQPRLAHLKAMGLRISIDDFGTGYSSLAHLMELPIDKLKIDRAFVRDLPQNARAAAVIRAIIQIGQSLGMTVVAEGIETEAQRVFLADQGCDHLQGLLIGAPMPQAAFEAWVDARRAGAPAGAGAE